MGKRRMDQIVALVGSRRYCFVIMPYRSMGLLYEHVCTVVEESTGLKCIRADEVPGSGQPLLKKLHDLIRGAELCLVELSEPSPNVYYEVGFAAAAGRPMLALCREGTAIPTDLQGLERIEYTDTPSKLPRLDHELKLHLVTLVASDVQLLRSMLVGPEASPSFVVCSPRWHTREDQLADIRTYGDYLGVIGVTYSLGALLGKDGVPELVSARRPSQDLMEKDANFYLIGSPRANFLVEDAMTGLQTGATTPWRFETGPEATVSTLHGSRHGSPFRHDADNTKLDPAEDFGIVLRGPHPGHPNRQILVMAGTRALGTGAACIAATRPEFIQQIRNRLRDADLSDKTKTIWALVSARPDPRDGHTSPEYVTLVDVGVVG